MWVGIALIAAQLIVTAVGDLETLEFVYVVVLGWHTCVAAIMFGVLILRAFERDAVELGAQLHCADRIGGRMDAVKWLGIVVGAYAGLVVAFECFVVTMGHRQAARGIQPGEDWLVITTTDADGSNDTVVAGVESGGHLYVAANHWPRSWYNRVVKNPDVDVIRAGERMSYRAVPVTGDERVRIALDYKLPWAIRLLTGFPPRSFLRLNPRSRSAQ